jgi:hypothetical protein
MYKKKFLEKMLQCTKNMLTLHPVWLYLCSYDDIDF